MELELVPLTVTQLIFPGRRPRFTGPDPDLRNARIEINVSIMTAFANVAVDREERSILVFCHEFHFYDEINVGNTGGAILYSQTLA